MYKRQSAGSTFKRPEGYFAGKLISDAGLKGKTIGGAQVSEKHAGFIVNIDVYKRQVLQTAAGRMIFTKMVTAA